jgi:actin-like protein 6A
MQHAALMHMLNAPCNVLRRDRLSVKPEEFALLLTEPTHNSRAARERLTELVFETFQSPALFLAKNAMLSAFATARQTALVVDSGYRATTGQ